MSIDSGEYSLWKYSEYSDTSDLFTGQDGHCYYFYSLGIDSAGNIEQIPQTYDAFTCLSLGQCDYLIGDISGDGQRLGGDVTYGVRFFKGIGTAPRDSCYMDSTHTYLYVAADCNGNCEFRGSDITRLVSYFKGIASLSCCHFFPTALPPLLKGQKQIVNTEN